MMGTIDHYLSRPAASELCETLVPRQGSGRAKFALGIKHYPAAGKGPELRQFLEERVRTDIPGRIGAHLTTQVAPPDGATFLVPHLFASLAGLDEFRAAGGRTCHSKPS